MPSYGEYHGIWTNKLAAQADMFANALNRLGSEKSAFVSSEWPFLGMQTVMGVFGSPLQSPLPRATDTIVTEQLRAAVDSFLRVRHMLLCARSAQTNDAATTTANAALVQLGHRALFDILGSRPILFKALQSDRDGNPSSVIDELLDATSMDAVTTGRVRGWVTPQPESSLTNNMRRRLLHLCGSRRVDLVDRIGALKLDDLHSRASGYGVPTGQLMRQRIDESAVWVVPACGLGLAGPMGISSTHTLEDAVVWLNVLKFQLDAPSVAPSTYSATQALWSGSGHVTTKWIATKPSETQHPYLFETSDTGESGRTTEGTFCLVENVASLPSAFPTNASGALPRTVRDAFEQMRSVEKEMSDATILGNPATRVATTGLFRERTRTLLWMVDRFVQLHVLLTAQTQAQKEQGKLPLHLVSPPPDWNETTLVHAVVALAVARTLCVTAFSMSLDVRVVHPMDDHALREALSPALALASETLPDAKTRANDIPVRAVPLAELCHVLAACLP